MAIVLFTFLLTTALYGAGLFFAWRRVMEHLKENDEASRAFAEHILVPLLGRKFERDNEPGRQVSGAEDQDDR